MLKRYWINPTTREWGVLEPGLKGVRMAFRLGGQQDDGRAGDESVGGGIRLLNRQEFLEWSNALDMDGHALTFSPLPPVAKVETAEPSQRTGMNRKPFQRSTLLAQVA